MCSKATSPQTVHCEQPPLHILLHNSLTIVNEKLPLGVNQHAPAPPHRSQADGLPTSYPHQMLCYALEDIRAPLALQIVDQRSQVASMAHQQSHCNHQAMIVQAPAADLCDSHHGAKLTRQSLPDKFAFTGGKYFTPSMHRRQRSRNHRSKRSSVLSRKKKSKKFDNVLQKVSKRKVAAVCSDALILQQMEAFVRCDDTDFLSFCEL